MTLNYLFPPLELIPSNNLIVIPWPLAPSLASIWRWCGSRRAESVSSSDNIVVFTWLLPSARRRGRRASDCT